MCMYMYVCMCVCLYISLARVCTDNGIWHSQDILKSKNIQSKVHVLPFCREGIIISWS